MAECTGSVARKAPTRLLLCSRYNGLEMPFTVKDFQGLLRLLERQPQWKDELRAVLLGEEFLELPRAIKELARAQRAASRQIRALTQAQQRAEERITRLEEAIAALAEAQARTEEQVRQLTEAQARTEERVTRLEETVARLAEAQARTEETVRLLLTTVDGLRRDMEGIKRDVGRLRGESLERTYRERAHAYFQRILDRIRVVDSQTLSSLLDEAVQAGRITPEERFDVLLADVVVAGRREGEELYLVAEVSATIEAGDVERARRRAKTLEKAVGRRTIPVVAGESLSDDANTQREARTVWRVLDGRAEPPEA